MVPVERPLCLHILHLEDSVADHRLVKVALGASALKIQLSHVDNLADFRTAIALLRFDVILADYQLAGFTAIEAWNFVATRAQSPPFILLSGAIGETAAVEAIRLGMADYVLKDHLPRLPHVISRAVEVHQARLQREIAVRELADSERRLALLTEHLQDSIEKERAAIAREIHDDIGGALTAIRFDLGWIERNSSELSAVEHANSAIEMLQHALGASQRIMKDLRPPVLDQGLPAALEWLTMDFERRTGIHVRLSVTLLGTHISAQLRLVAYRTAQEALTNVSKHAGASKVTVDVADGEGVLTVEITDNGRGMPADAKNKHQSFGLAGLSERAKTVGGWLDVSSRLEHGTSVILSVPLPARNATPEEQP